MQDTNNIRIKDLCPLISPALLLDEIPISETAQKNVNQARQEIGKVITGEDDRLVVIVGPCSIHDPVGAIAYAKHLQQAITKYQDELCIIMRVYFEKPRTTIGWKGLINDPKLDGSFSINTGLRTARRLLLDINNLGVATGSEFLDTTIPQYLTDLISWSAIGARTTESQIHRELASGLSMPVGFKNGTTGNIQIAIDAVYAAQHPHHFLGVTKQGIAAIVSTEGNELCHVILRGSNTGPNYDSQTINETTESLQGRKLYPRLMVDCSHGNSSKDHTRQKLVADEICKQIAIGRGTVFGLMLESNIVAGNQKLTPGTPLTYGQSITDACIDWEETVNILDKLQIAVQNRRNKLTHPEVHHV